MKKMISITISVLLAAGAASPALAYYGEWEGDATGDCGAHIKPFQPWEGELYVDEYPYTDHFDGYWGYDETNELYGSNISTTTYGGYTMYKLTDGTWNYQQGRPYGTWDCDFVPALDTCDGEWESDDVGCTDGTLWGTEQ